VDVTGPEARPLCPPDRVRPRRKREGCVRPLASGARRKRSPEASHTISCAGGRPVDRRVRGRLGRSRVGSGLKSPHWMPRAEACAQSGGLGRTETTRPFPRHSERHGIYLCCPPPPSRIRRGAQPVGSGAAQQSRSRSGRVCLVGSSRRLLPAGQKRSAPNVTELPSPRHGRCHPDPSSCPFLQQKRCCFHSTL
jgi:hypothetical protein